MKSALIFFLFLPLGLLAQSQWRMKIPGVKIKSEVWYNYNPEKDYWYSDYFEMHYDTAGYPTSFYLGNGKHKRRNTIHFTYDNEGRDLKQYSKGSVSFENNYTYDEKNDVLIVRDSHLRETQ